MFAFSSSLRRPIFLAKPDDDTLAGGSGGDGADDEEDKPKSLTQKQLDSMFGEKGKAAAAKREREMLAELGVPDLAAAKAKLAAADTAEASQKTELQKAQDLAAKEKKRADDAEAARTAALASASETMLRAAVNTAATEAGCAPAELRTLWLLLSDDKELRDTIEASEDDPAEFEGVTEAVKKILDAHPLWVEGEPVKRGAGDVNARRRSVQPGANHDEIVKKKRTSSEYSSL